MIEHRLLTINGLSDRSLLAPDSARALLVGEIEAGRLMSLDSPHWEQVRDERGRLQLRERHTFGGMRLTPASVLAWAERWPERATPLFSTDILATFAPALANPEH